MKIPEYLHDKKGSNRIPDKIPIISGLSIIPVIPSITVIHSGKLKPEQTKYPLIILCFILAIFLLILPVQAVPAEDSGTFHQDDFYSGIFMTENDPGTISVRWITEDNNDNFSIRYHLNTTGSDEEMNVNITLKHSENQILNSTISKQNISGLTLYSAGISVYPGCKISGTLLRKGIPVQPFSFKIPDKNNGFEFIVLSDLHSSPENDADIEPEIPVIETITDCINSYEKPAFTVISGDLVHDGYRLPEWQEFFSRTSALLNKTVLYTTPGNHEKNSTYYYEIFGYPQFYSKNNGGCRFVFLDSNDNAAALFPKQRELIDDKTGNSGSDEKSPMNFIFFHHPPYSSDERHPGGWKNIRKAWGDSFENTKNTVVFSGHVHAYERFESGNVTYIVCGTGGGELYNLGIYPDDKNIPKRTIENKYGYMKVRIIPGGSSADISFISPVISGINSTHSGQLKYLPEIIDYSITGDYYSNNQFMENIMKISQKLPLIGI